MIFSARSEDDASSVTGIEANSDTNERRLGMLESKLDLILVHLGNLSADTSSKPAVVPERRKTDAKFTALSERIDGLAARFDRFQSTLEALAAQSPVQDTATSPETSDPLPTRMPMLFDAEKVGFERLLTGFRHVLRDLSTQAAHARTTEDVTVADPSMDAIDESASAISAHVTSAVAALLEPVEARIGQLQSVIEAQSAPNGLSRSNSLFEAEKVGLERLLTGFRFVLRDLAQHVQSGSQPTAEARHPPETDEIVEQLSGLSAGLSQLNARIDRFEALMETNMATAASTRPSARFEAEKVGFERILTGFRFVLRDMAADRPNNQSSRDSDPAETASANAQGTDGALILARLDAVSDQLGRLETNAPQDAMETLAARIDELANVINSIGSFSATPRSNAVFEAEKLGFTRLLTGFRLVLRDLADRVQALEIAPAVKSIDNFVNAPQTVPAVTEVEPAPAAKLPEFDARKHDLIHLRAALSLVLRHVSQSADALDRAVERVNVAGNAAEHGSEQDDRSAHVVARLDAFEGMLTDFVRTSTKSSPIPALALLPEPERDHTSLALEPLRASLQDLLAGYQVTLAGLRRESDDLRALIGGGTSSAHAGANQAAAFDPATDAMVRGLRRINALADRLAVTVKTAGDVSLAGSDLSAQPAIAADIRAQTAEFLAIGSALMTEFQRSA